MRASSQLFWLTILPKGANAHQRPLGFWCANRPCQQTCCKPPGALNTLGFEFRSETSLGSSTTGDIAVNTSTKTLIVALLALVVSPTLSLAQVRDAASKAQGDYGRGAPTLVTGTAPAYSFAAPAVPAPQPATRAFSYDATRQAPRSDAMAPAPARQATQQPAPSQAVRRFSYEPSYAAPRPTYFPSRVWQSGLRDAGSKVRGEY